MFSLFSGVFKRHQPPNIPQGLVYEEAKRIFREQLVAYNVTWISALVPFKQKRTGKYTLW